MDKIFIKGLKLPAHIGIYEWEQRVGQTVSIDLEMQTDIKQAALTDDVTTTINYFAVIQRIEQILAAQHFKLVETLADTIAQTLQTEFSIKWLKLTVGKPNILPQTDLVGVTIERSII